MGEFCGLSGTSHLEHWNGAVPGPLGLVHTVLVSLV